MAIESLFERGKLPDWQEFGRALRKDRRLAEDTLRVCEWRVDEGSAELARTLVYQLYPELRNRVSGPAPDAQRDAEGAGHLNFKGEEWTLMAIESLLERGKLPDWQEFGRALRRDRRLGEDTLRVCEGPVDEGSAELARTLVYHLYPDLRNTTLTGQLPPIPNR